MMKSMHKLQRFFSTTTLPSLHVVDLSKCVPNIYHQLCLEEALLRTCNVNYLLLSNFDTESIVLGRSNKIHELINEENVRANNIPVVRRFSGGGTVYTDHKSQFVTFIINTESLPSINPYPRSIMQWTGEIYQHALKGNNSNVPQFKLRENDYCFESLKFGGNAQSITAKRWLHHTSILWEFDENKMASYLQFPPTSPKYREGRSHSEFLCSLRERYNDVLNMNMDINQSRLYFQDKLIESLSREFCVKIQNWNNDNVQEVVNRPHRASTRIVDWINSN